MSSVALMVGGVAHGRLIAIQRDQFRIRIPVTQSPVWCPTPDATVVEMPEDRYYSSPTRLLGRTLNTWIVEGLSKKEKIDLLFSLLVSDDAKGVATNGDQG